MRCWWWRGSCLAVVLLVPGISARTAAAQSSTDRTALATLRDSLDAVTSARELGRIGKDWSGPRSTTMDRLRRGFHSLAAARLSGSRSDLDDALNAFDWAVTSGRELPYPWFGRALAKLALSEGRFIPKETAGQPLGSNYYQGFAADLARAFEREAAFPPGIELLAEILPPQGDRTQPAAFVAALEAATRGSTDDPRVHLALGRAYRAAWRDEDALDQFAAFRATGGDASLASVERARSLAALGRLEEAAEAYLHGAELDATETRRVYRRDLAWVATEEELTAFDSVPAPLMRRWISDFWALRDAESLRLPGERLEEHLRRWAYAFRHFRVIAPERKTDFWMVMNPDIGPCMDAGPKTIDNLT